MGEVVQMRGGGSGAANDGVISPIVVGESKPVGNGSTESGFKLAAEAFAAELSVYGAGVSAGGHDPAKPKQGVKMATERELTDAKLEAVEARVEARLAGIEGKIDRLLDRVEDSVTASKEAKAEATLAKTAAGNTKWNILFTGLTVAALLIAMWAIWSQGMELVAGMFSVNPPAYPPSQ